MHNVLHRDPRSQHLRRRLDWPDTTIQNLNGQVVFYALMVDSNSFEYLMSYVSIDANLVHGLAFCDKRRTPR